MSSTSVPNGKTAARAHAPAAANGSAPAAAPAANGAQKQSVPVPAAAAAGAAKPAGASKTSAVPPAPAAKTSTKSSASASASASTSTAGIPPQPTGRDTTVTPIQKVHPSKTSTGLGTANVNATPEGKVDFPWEKIGFFINAKHPPSIEALRALSLESSSKNMYKYVSEKYYGDLYWNTSLIVGTCLFAWLIGRIGGGLFALLFILTCSFTVYRSEFRRFNVNLRDDMMRVSARDSLDDRIETMQWLNAFLAKFWVIYMPALSDMVITQANATMKDIDPPPPIKKLSLDEFTLGSKAPTVNSIRSFSKLGADTYQMDWDFGFAPNDTDDMTKNELKNKIDPKVALGISVGKGVVSASLPILVEDMSFKGKLRITFELGDTFPFLNVVSIMFLEPPAIDYALKPVGGNTFGIDIMSMIPGLSSFVNSIINSQLAPMMYAPNSLDINVHDIMEGMMPGAKGVLGVRIRGAEYLKDTDINPYFEYFLEQKSADKFRTDIKGNTNTPVFNETKFILVENLQQKLQFELHGVNEEGETERLAEAEFEMDSLLQDDDQPMTELKLLRKGRSAGRMLVDISWFGVLEGKKQDDGTNGPAPESDIGIIDLTLESAKQLDTSRSLLGKLSTYAEVYVNKKLVNKSRLFKSTNDPEYNLRTEELVQSKSSTPIKILIKDISSYGETTVASYKSHSLLDLIGMGAEGGKWIDFTSGAGKLRLKVHWKPLPNVGMTEAQTFVPPVGALRVYVAGCENLSNVVTMGTIDPYVRVLAGGEECAATSIVMDSTSPKFNDVFYIPLSSKHEQVALQAVHSGSSKVLGSIALDTARFFKKDYDPQADSSKGLTKGQLVKNGHAEGTIYYKVVYLPIVPILSQKEIRDKANKTAKKGGNKAELEELEEQAKMLEDYKKHPDAYKWVDEDDDDDESDEDDAKKVDMPLDQLLQHNSGVLGINIVRGTLQPKKAYLQCLLDEKSYPEFVSSAAKGGKLHSCAGQAFVRDLENSVITFRLSKKATVTSRDDVIAQTEEPIKVKDLLTKGHKDATVVSFEGNKIELTLEYAPCTVALGPSETMNDTGVLSLKIVSGSGLKSMDSGGASDPFVAVMLNGAQTFKTQIVKKSLDPVWNEDTTVVIPSRTRSELKLDVYDWDRVGDNELMGSIVMDLTKLPANKETAMEFKLDTQGSIKINAAFKPMYVQAAVAGVSGSGALGALAGAPGKVIGGAVDAVGDVGGAASAAVGGAANLATGAVGGAASAATGAVGGAAKGLMKPFGQKSSRKSMSTPPSPVKGGASRSSVPSSPAAGRSSIDSGATFASSALGDTLPGRVTVGKLVGPKSKDALFVKVSIASAHKKKDIFKTHAAKYDSAGGDYKWEESVPFKAPGEAKVIFSVREHHRMGRSTELSTGEISLTDVAGRSDNINVPCGDSQLVVNFNYGTNA